MSEATLAAILLTLKVAFVSTLCLWIPATLLAYWFARQNTRASLLCSSIVGLPLVLPPTAVGYLLLRFFALDGPLGPEVLGFHINFLLTWKAAIVAAAVMALPLVVRTSKVAFEGVDPRLEMMSRTLGHGPVRTFFLVSLPLASRGLLAANILGFTRAVGEFGAIVTVAGNIPYKTQTLASAIFSAQQVGQHDEAYVLIAIALALGFAAIIGSELLSRPPPSRRLDR
jgi:molybdate transport system permease protein